MRRVQAWPVLRGMAERCLMMLEPLTLLLPALQLAQALALGWLPQPVLPWRPL